MPCFLLAGAAAVGAVFGVRKVRKNRNKRDPNRVWHGKRRGSWWPFGMDW